MTTGTRWHKESTRTTEVNTTLNLLRQFFHDKASDLVLWRLWSPGGFTAAWFHSVKVGLNHESFTPETTECFLFTSTGTESAHSPVAASGIEMQASSSLWWCKCIFKCCLRVSFSIEGSLFAECSQSQLYSTVQHWHVTECFTQDIKCIKAAGVMFTCWMK